ncbi:hypothetical protein BDK51DRAFT_9410, partial [Blyttiomyces helicus]
ACCNTAPFESEHVPRSQFERIGDLPAYFVGEKASKAIPPNFDANLQLSISTQQLADALAAHGFRVAMPDFFRATP